jgi:hypothetical protein
LRWLALFGQFLERLSLETLRVYYKSNLPFSFPFAILF